MRIIYLILIMALGCNPQTPPVQPIPDDIAKYLEGSELHHYMGAMDDSGHAYNVRLFKVMEFTMTDTSTWIGDLQTSSRYYFSKDDQLSWQYMFMTGADSVLQEVWDYYYEWPIKYDSLVYNLEVHTDSLIKHQRWGDSPIITLERGRSWIMQENNWSLK